MQNDACKYRYLVRQFSSTIGLQYLRAIHLNDSLCGLHSRKDRHQNVGLGEIGLAGFQHIVRDERTKGIPIILETPSFDLPQEVWGVEISVLGRLSLDASDTDSGNVGELIEELRAAVQKAKGPKRKRDED
jgi:AP endonuclease-1